MTLCNYYVADAFTSQPYQGNPAGVVPDGEHLTDEQMQQIAGEINLSETAFVSPATSSEADIRIRWFTPRVEVKMCGHATLATAHILAQIGRWTDAARPLRIETVSGVLTVERDLAGVRPLLWLRLITPRLTRAMLDPTAVADSCRISFQDFIPRLPLMVSQDRDLIVPVKDHLVLMRAAPDFGALRDVCVRNQLRGVCLTTPKAVSAAHNLQSRVFAPTEGIDEDPVTGSVYGPLGAYLLLHNMIPLMDGEAIAQCIQTPASGRVGLVKVWLHQNLDGPLEWVKVGGECVTTLEGVVVG